MDQSREKLQNRIAQIKDRPLQELLRDLTDSAWSWRQGDQAAVTTDRWITVGGQTVRGTTTQEKAPETVGGQTDGQGQTIPAKDGKDGKDGRDGIDGKDGIPGPAGVDGAPGPAGPAGPTINHDLLPGLNAGDYQHLSVAQKTDLTDAGDSALHYHSTDRARAYHTGTQLASTISDFSSAADARITAQKGAANGIAPLGSDTRIPLSYLPATTIVETSVVASQAAMLALTAQQGDVAVRTDLSKAFILKAEPASTLANWQELLSPTDAVVSVFGRTGPVTAQVGDYSAFYQPLDADLTAIAGLATTAYGRSFLTLADAAAALTLIGAQPAGSYQPLDADLTAIAALSTQAFGRSLLTAVDASAGRSLLGAQVAGSYEPSIAAGSTAQYWRGDKTWQTMNAAAVGLGNVLNVAQEPALGNPGTSGFLLSSTTAGVRSWVAPYSHPATHPQSVVDAASGWITDALAGKQASLGFTPVQQGGGTSQTTNKLYIGWSAGNVLCLQVDSTDFGHTWPIAISGHSADSAKLGGQLPSYYATAASLSGCQPLNANLTALSTGQTNAIEVANNVGANNYFSDTTVGDTIFRWGAPYTEKVRFGIMSTSAGSNASSLWFSASAAGSNYSFTASSFIKSGGTSAQFLKADGSVDSTSYAIAASLAGYQPLDADLTSIAALATTSYGRSFLTLADAAAARAWMNMGVAEMGSSAYDSNMAWFGRAGYNSSLFGKGFLTNGESAWVCAQPGSTVNLRIGDTNVVNCQSGAVNINTKLWGQDASFGSTVDAITSVKGGAAKIGTSNVFSGWAWMGMNAVNEGNYGVHTNGNSLALIANNNNSMYLYSGGTAMVTISSTGVDLPYLKTLKFSAIVTIGGGTVLPVVAPGEVVMLVGASTGSVTNNPVTNASQTCKYRTTSGAQASAAAGGATVNFDLYGNVAFLVGRTTGSATLLS